MAKPGENKDKGKGAGSPPPPPPETKPKDPVEETPKDPEETKPTKKPEKVVFTSSHNQPICGHDFTKGNCETDDPELIHSLRANWHFGRDLFEVEKEKVKKDGTD